VAYARAGRKVVLVDLDLRRPFLHELFDTPQVPGVTNVAVGATELVETIRRIALTDGPAAGAEANGNGNGNGNGHGNGHVRAVMEVLPAGTLPPDPGEFLGTQALAEVLKQLRQRADIVIVDAAPLLHVGDSVSLAAAVDAILLVTKLEAVRRPMLDELDRLLSRSPAAVIGFVATGAEADSAYGYGYGAYRGHTAETPEQEKARVP
jgi:Mrp family chromosome partitioning ATPase